MVIINSKDNYKYQCISVPSFDSQYKNKIQEGNKPWRDPHFPWKAKQPQKVKISFGIKAQIFVFVLTWTLPYCKLLAW